MTGTVNLTPALLEVQALCDGTRTAKEIADVLGIPRPDVHNRIRRIRLMTGVAPDVRLATRSSTTFAAKSARVDAQLAAVEACPRCGLRMFWGVEAHLREGCLSLDHEAASRPGGWSL